MKAQKWNFKKKAYEEYKLPDNCPLISHDMELIIKCAECEKKIRCGEAFTSHTIHNKIRLGYPICEECYMKELRDERSKAKI